MDIKQQVEDLKNKLSIYIVDFWHEGTEWYCKYSNGWIEQGGYITSDFNSVNFKIPFTTPNYFFSRSPVGIDNLATMAYSYVGSGDDKKDTRTTDGVTFYDGSYCLGYVWVARGF